ncbi:MAG: bifunctional glutamate N-acetyltransferase/amino-acid acetyltransferase ArgJ [Firmicutes bacterium]|nr:bifunctional glutamate N-acetyltransferase/amino-acid acetyltransferase ArgJ [Bacillota bacterium]
MFTLISGGVTAPNGFKAAGVEAEIKNKNKKDLAIIFSEKPAAAAAVHTLNRVKAAPILVNQEHLANGQAQAIVVNSGNANACNGEQGVADARRIAALAAELLGIAPQDVLVASTGVIGQPLPMERIEKGIREAVQKLDKAGGTAAAEAIMTTDTFKKELAIEITIQGKTVKIGAMAKGSGMIHPHMATMLAFLTTDAAVTPTALQQAIRTATEQSFNLVTVDADMSTNDTAIILANGLAGNQPLTENSIDFPQFQAAVTFVCVELAKKIARDGEGATKLIEVQVKHAPTRQDARTAALAVVKSNLVKSAIFGKDANWGRILAAIGSSAAEFRPDQVDIWLGEVQVAADGSGLPFDEEAARQVLARPEVVITVDMKLGDAEATAWGCDLTYDYVKINASYRS